MNEGTPLINPEELTPELTPEEMTLPTREQLEAKQTEAEKKPDEPEDKNESDEAEEPVDEPVYQNTVEDPGEFQPADYSFEVTIYDEEGKNGKNVKVDSVERFEQLLEEEKNFGSASALMKAQRLATKMESNLERDRKSYETDKKAFNDQQAKVEADNAAVNQMASELDYLESKGELPQVAKKYQNADWSDPEVAKQPGVKERVELLDYMKKENGARIKAGLRPFSSVVDAFNQYDREQARSAIKSAEDKAGEARRQAGARVAGVNPAPVSAVPKGVMVGRSFGDLSNLSNMQ